MAVNLSLQKAKSRKQTSLRAQNKQNRKKDADLRETYNTETRKSDSRISQLSTNTNSDVFTDTEKSKLGDIVDIDIDINRSSLYSIEGGADTEDVDVDVDVRDVDVPTSEILSLLEQAKRNEKEKEKEKEG